MPKALQLQTFMDETNYELRHQDLVIIAGPMLGKLGAPEFRSQLLDTQQSSHSNRTETAHLPVNTNILPGPDPKLALE